MHMILDMSILQIWALNDDANQILGYDVKNDTRAIELHKIPSTLPIWLAAYSVDLDISLVIIRNHICVPWS